MTTEPAPDGLPISVVLKLEKADTPLGEAPLPDDIIVDNSKRVSLVVGEDDERVFDLDYIYQAESTERDIYARTLVPILNAFLDGVSGAVVVFGSADAARVEMVQGGDDADHKGVVHKIVESVFVGLERKMKGLAERGAGEMTYDLSVSFVEVYDEVIQDLLNSQKRDLPIREDLVHGMYVQGCTQAGPMMTSGAVMEAFAAGIEARSKEPTDFGPPQQYASSVFQLRLKTVVKGARSKKSELISTLTVAEIAGAEKLAVADHVALRAREGPRLNKSALAFSACAEALKAGREADFVPHADSKTTLLLKEVLGGNCLTTCIGVVRQGDTATSLATMEMAAHLARGVCFPVIMEVTTRGLVRRLRVQTKQVRDELAEIKFGVASEEAKVKDGEADLMMKITELEGRGIRDNLEKLKLQEEREKLQERFKEFRGKYNDLVDAKAEAQAQLIEAEEEKLKISKALLDLQIKNNQLQEAVDKDKFELGAKLMSAENDLVEMEMRRQAAVEKLEELHRQCAELTEEKREMSMELVTLKSNLVSRTRELRGMTAKNEDLGTEILTLVNQKAVLEETAQVGSSRLAEAEKRASTLGEQLETMRADYLLVKTKLKETLDTVDATNAARVRAELAAERAKLDFEAKQLEVQKSMADYTTSVDKEVIKAQQSSGADSAAAHRAREEATRQIATLEATVRTQQRKIADYRAQLGEVEEEASKQGERNSELESRMRADLDDHRARLLKHLSADESDEARQAVIDDLVGTYRKRESEADALIAELRRDNFAVLRRLRNVKERARDAHYRVADLTTDPREKADMENAVKLLDVDDGEGSALEAKLSSELDAARSQLAAARREAAQAQEGRVSTAAGSRRVKQEMQQKLDDLQAENDRLRASGGGGGGGADAEELEDAKADIKRLKSELREAKKAAEGAGAGAGGSGMSPEDEEEMDELRKNLADAEDEIKLLKKQLAEARKAAKEAQESVEKRAKELAAESGGGDDTGAGKKGRRGSITGVPKSARTAIEVDDDAPKGTLLEQLKASETKAVQLLSRNTVLEEELKNYQKYLKTQVMKYQKEIARLKKELAMWKQKAGG